MPNSALLTLQQVKAHLRYPTPAQPAPDDAALQAFINAADECMAYECDGTLPREYDERYDGGDYSIFLRHRPIVAVQNVEEGWGWTNFELDYQDPNTAPADTTLFGYSIDSPVNGVISRRSVASVQVPFRPGGKNIHVEYVAGYETVPAAIILASLELVAHWWQNSQLRAVVQGGANVSYDATMGASYTRDTERGEQNVNVGVPVRILELIKTHRHLPFIA